MSESASGGPPANVDQRLRRQRREIDKLRSRIVELEHEVQECRQLSRRLADLADVVAELLLPLADRDDERISALLADYQRSL